MTIFFSTKELEALLMRSNRSNLIMKKDDDMTPNNQVTIIAIVLLFLVISVKMKFVTVNQKFYF